MPLVGGPGRSRVCGAAVPQSCWQRSGVLLAGGHYARDSAAGHLWRPVPQHLLGNSYDFSRTPPEMGELYATSQCSAPVKASDCRSCHCPPQRTTWRRPARTQRPLTTLTPVRSWAIPPASLRLLDLAQHSIARRPAVGCDLCGRRTVAAWVTPAILPTRCQKWGASSATGPCTATIVSTLLLSSPLSFARVNMTLFDARCEGRPEPALRSTAEAHGHVEDIGRRPGNAPLGPKAEGASPTSRCCRRPEPPHRDSGCRPAP